MLSGAGAQQQMRSFEMTISNAKWVKDEMMDNAQQSIQAEINGVVSFVPIDQQNADYAEIQRLVAAGELTIDDAD